MTTSPHTTSEPIFDRPEYLRVSEARAAFLRELLPPLRQRLELRTALDAGCGVGYFATLLVELGFAVTAFDGREENVREAAARVPAARVFTANVEDPALRQQGAFDLVLCCGLLYHLENPFAAVRNLHALTTRVLVMESMCVPEPGAALHLHREGRTEDQGLDYVAFYPTEDCLISMCIHAGFQHVYRTTRLPDHDEFRETASSKRRRTVLVASREPLQSELLSEVPGAAANANLWTKSAPLSDLNAPRVLRFLRKPGREKFRSLAFRWVHAVPGVPVPIRLPWGHWWLATNDACGLRILGGAFETNEQNFISAFLEPGMTVLDVGAHQGLYSLLASHHVGAAGRVISFEPSPRERRLLRRHLRLNNCHNVRVESTALGEAAGEANLYVVEGGETGCNSLRAPNVQQPTRQVAVRVRTLDEFLHQEKIERVDFMKLDVEGAELSVLRGAVELLGRSPRPVILAEVYDIRTSPWGYAAREIIDFLSARGYRWFLPDEQGRLAPVDTHRERFDANFVGVPEERIEHVRRLMLPGADGQ